MAKAFTRTSIATCAAILALALGGCASPVQPRAVTAPDLAENACGNPTPTAEPRLVYVNGVPDACAIYVPGTDTLVDMATLRRE